MFSDVTFSESPFSSIASLGFYNGEEFVFNLSLGTRVIYFSLPIRY